MLGIPDNSYGFVFRSTLSSFTALYLENRTLNETRDKLLDGLDEDDVLDFDKLLNGDEVE